jgi:hypothetical protein
MAATPSVTAASKTGTNDDNVIFGESQAEAQRLDLQHFVICDTMKGQLVTAPIDLSKGGLKVLDQATGSGERSHLFFSRYLSVNYEVCRSSTELLMLSVRHLDSRRAQMYQRGTKHMGRH